jgi:hypothetical protein
MPRGTGLATLNFPASAQAAEYSSLVITSDSNPRNTWGVSSPAPVASSGVWGLAFGNGVFVAVAGGTASAATSADGIVWVPRTLPSPQTWTSVTFVNGNFIALTSNSEGVAAYSTNGVAWMPSTMPLLANWTSVIYASGKYIASTNNDLGFAISTDGVTWGLQTTAPDSVDTIVFGNGKFVVICGGTAVYTSLDTNTWSGPFSPTSDPLYGLAFGNGVFVIVTGHLSGIGVAVLTSVDGATWVLEAIIETEYGFQKLSFSNGSFYISMGQDVYLSADGRSLSLSHVFDTVDVALTSPVIYGAGKSLALGGAATVMSWSPNVRVVATSNTLTSPSKPNPGSNTAAVTVSVPAITADSSISAYLVSDTTADHNTYAYSDERLDGDFKVRYVWGTP